MGVDFELFLVLATLITGIIALIDIVFFARHRQTAILPKLVEYARSFFPVLLIVLLLRSFLVEPFRIPTGSLEPTLLPGDFVAANKFAYGLRLPVWHNKVLAIGEPKTGDIAVFRDVQQPDKDLIKRVIGTPGDRIVYVNKVLYINGVEAPQVKIGTAIDYDEEGNAIPVEVYQETLNGIKHLIYINPEKPPENGVYVVPEGSYFMMGDNRDNSYDSRYWGYMPEANVIGKAFIIWFSWNKATSSVRWHRLGARISQLDTMPVS